MRKCKISSPLHLYALMLGNNTVYTCDHTVGFRAFPGILIYFSSYQSRTTPDVLHSLRFSRGKYLRFYFSSKPSSVMCCEQNVRCIFHCLKSLPCKDVHVCNFNSRLFDVRVSIDRWRWSTNNRYFLWQYTISYFTQIPKSNEHYRISKTTFTLLERGY